MPLPPKGIWDLQVQVLVLVLVCPLPVQIFTYKAKLCKKVTNLLAKLRFALVLVSLSFALHNQTFATRKTKPPFLARQTFFLTFFCSFRYDPKLVFFFTFGKISIPSLPPLGVWLSFLPSVKSRFPYPCKP